MDESRVLKLKEQIDALIIEGKSSLYFEMEKTILNKDRTRRYRASLYMTTSRKVEEMVKRMKSS